MRDLQYSLISQARLTTAAAAVHLLLIVMTLVLVLACILSYIVARAIYMPVRRLRESIAEMELACRTDRDVCIHDGIREIDQIERRFLAALSSNLDYQERYRKNAPLLREKLLWDLLTGRTDDSTVPRNLSLYRIEVRGPRFPVLLVQYPEELLGRHHLKTHFFDEVQQFVGPRPGSEATPFAELMDSQYVVICLQGVSDQAFEELGGRLYSHLARSFPWIEETRGRVPSGRC